jgi:acetyl esterase/lipase
MVRLAFSILFFLISLLTVLKAPAYFLWLVAIIIDEFPWIPFVITAIFLLSGLKNPVQPLLSNILLTTALVLFSTPVIRALKVSSHLTEALGKSFGLLSPAPETVAPFRVMRMFSRNDKITPVQYAYKKTANGNLMLDFYPSKLSGKRPCIIVVHGGSWKSGDNKQLPELNSILAEKGYHVAAINYRLAPGAISPAPVDDVREAIAFVKSQGEKWHVDTTRIILLGRSAGAQIALLAAYTLKDPDIKGVIDFYGPADMVWGYSIPSNPLIMNSRKVMEDYLGGTYHAKPENFQRSSPLLHVSRNAPPTLIIHGKNDVLVAYEHSRRLNARLQELGVKHHFLTLPWATHGFDYNINGPGGQLSTHSVLYFLEKITQ